MFLLIEYCCGTPPSCLEVMGWVVGGGGGWWVVVAWSNLVSAQGPLVLGLGLRVWGQGLTINKLKVELINNMCYQLSFMFHTESLQGLEFY